MKVVILGGGISGLVCAYELGKRGIETTLLEKKEEIGGLGSSHVRLKYNIEKTYHAIFAGDSHTIRLLRELEILESVKWFPTKLAFYNNGKKYSLSTPLDILKNDNLSLFDKIVLGRIYLELKFLKNWRKLDDISAKEWILSKKSEKLYHFLFEPLINIKWGDERDSVSATWLWGRINPRASTRDYGGANENMGYPIGGYSTIFNALIERIKGYNSKIHTCTQVKEIYFENDNIGYIVYSKNGKNKKIKPDIVINTIPTPVFLECCVNLPSSLRKIKNVEYETIICATFGMKERFIEEYQMPCAPGTATFGGIVEHTNFVPSDYYAGEHILYVFNYCKEGSKIWNTKDDKIIKEYINDLKKIDPNFDEETITWSEVYRNKYGTPIYKKDYLKYMPPIQFNNLYFGGMFNMYPINDFNNSIRVANEITQKISQKTS